MDVESPYITPRPVATEKLSLSEGNNLWDHLNERYDEIRVTEFFLEFIHDRDFRLIMEKGLSVLQKQAKELEQELSQYEVPLPQRPPANQESVLDPEIVEDRFIFRVIFFGIQGALNLHLRAVIDSIRNDGLRKYFLELLRQEIDMYSDFIKYGKMKGWTKIPPMYINKK